MNLTFLCQIQAVFANTPKACLWRRRKGVFGEVVQCSLLVGKAAGAANDLPVTPPAEQLVTPAPK